MSSKLLVALAGLALWSGSAQAADLGSFAFTRESSVTYHVLHPMHHIDGVSHQIEGEARITAGPDLALPLKLSIPIRSFDSGNGNRNRNMMLIMHAGRYPNALLEIRSVNWTSKRIEGARTTTEGTAKGDLTLNGATRPVDIQLGGFAEGDRLQVDAQFSFLLSDYAIERPSLLFRPVDDQVKLEVKGIALRH